MIELRGINFSRSSVASGTLGFDNCGYWIHKYTPVDYSRADLILKTTPVYFRRGNMPLNPANYYRPADRKPNCIKINFLTRSIVNAVNLSSPGLEDLLEMDVWQKFENPFWISYMPVGATEEKQWAETKKFTVIIKSHQPAFKSKFGSHLNVSCPNTGHDTKKIVGGAIDHLTVMDDLKIPKSIKFNIFAPTKMAKEISKYCDALFIPNPIPWGTVNEIPWNRLFLFSMIFRKSPLPKKYGSDGYSGVRQFPLAIKWVKEARAEGITIPIYVGGLFKPEHVDEVNAAGGNGVTVGATATYFYPWNVQKIIKKANEMKWRK